MYRSLLCNNKVILKYRNKYLSRHIHIEFQSPILKRLSSSDRVLQIARHDYIVTTAVSSTRHRLCTLRPVHQESRIFRANLDIHRVHTTRKRKDTIDWLHTKRRWILVPLITCYSQHMATWKRAISRNRTLIQWPQREQ